MKSSFTGGGNHCIGVVKSSDYSDWLIVYEDNMPMEEKRWGCFYTTKENFKAFIQGVKAGEFDHFVE